MLNFLSKIYNFLYGNDDYYDEINKQVCPICLEEIIISPNNLPACTLLQCTHKNIIHPSCLWSWILQNNPTDRMRTIVLHKQNNFTDYFTFEITCPLCREKNQILYRTL
jgi:hypothetical protein